MTPRISFAGFRQRFLPAEDGVAAIEFAIVATVLMMLLIVSTDIGLGYYSYTRVQSAAQAGAQYAAINGYDSAKISSAVTGSAMSPGLTATPSPSTFCGCAGSSSITSYACTAVCPDGSAAGTYVAVSAQRTYTTLLRYPGLPASFTQISTSTVRIK